MEGNARTRFTAKQRAELWERWKTGWKSDASPMLASMPQGHRSSAPAAMLLATGRRTDGSLGPWPDCHNQNETNKKPMTTTWEFNRPAPLREGAGKPRKKAKRERGLRLPGFKVNFGDLHHITK
jgi:hypothetical protein